MLAGRLLHFFTLSQKTSERHSCNTNKTLALNMNTLGKKKQVSSVARWSSTLHFGVLIREALENIPDISRGGGFTNWTKCISDSVSLCIDVELWCVFKWCVCVNVYVRDSEMKAWKRILT